MMYTSPQPALASKGSRAKQKALQLEHKKRLPPPSAHANQPTSYGTTPGQDRTQAALRLLGAGQQFQGAPASAPAPGPSQAVPMPPAQPDAI